MRQRARALAALLLMAAACAATERTVSQRESDSEKADAPAAATGRGEAAATPPDPAMPASPPSTKWKAHGNEPFWSVTVDADVLELRALGSGAQPETIRLPRPVGEATADRHLWIARGPEGEVRVEVRSRLCRDTMSGVTFPESVTVTVGGRTLEGCGGEPAALLMGEWLVTHVAGAPIAEGTRITLSFLAEDRIAGDASCNRYMGGYRLGGEGLRVESLASTRMACPPPRMEQEQRYLDLLRSVARHEFENDDPTRLVLVGAGEARIQARRP